MKTYLYVLLMLSLAACTSANKKQEQPVAEGESVVVDLQEDENAPAQGFDLEGSDPRAIVIADKVMKAMGGRKAWDETRYLTWNFFGVRKLLWDKWNGDVRVDYLNKDLQVIVNIHTMKGKVKKDGQELTHPDSLSQYLTQGKNAWINDSYWLVMPFKLKDSGVTLSYLKEDSTQAGKPAHLLELTFKDVGVTPENYYEVWVDMDTNLVSQWAFYRNHAASEPSFTMPWQDYKQYGQIMLSGNRGERHLTDIQVLEQVPDDTFQRFEALVL